MTDRTFDFLSRRSLLAALGLGGAAAVVASPPMPLSWTRRPSQGSWWEVGSPALGHGGIEEWQSQIGTSFSVEAEAGQATLKLIKVQPLNSRGQRPASLGRDRAFAAVFEAGPGGAPEGDAIYTMAHDTQGELAVFMTAGTGGGRLEAVFN